MANTASARKRARQADKRRAHNRAQRSRLRTAIKRVLQAVEAGDHEAALSAYRSAEPLLDRYAHRGLIHRNKAARHKQRLIARIRTLQ